MGKAKAKTKAAEGSTGICKEPVTTAEQAKGSAKLTDDERDRLKTAYAEFGAAEAAYKDASKDKKDAQDALANLVAEICKGNGPLFEGQESGDEEK